MRQRMRAFHVHIFADARPKLDGGQQLDGHQAQRQQRCAQVAARQLAIQAQIRLLPAGAEDHQQREQPPGQQHVELVIGVA